MRAILAASLVGFLLVPAAVCAQPKVQIPKPADIEKPKQPGPGDIVKPTKPDPTGGKKIRPDGPSRYDKIGGKTLDEWIAQLSSKDPSRCQAAVQAMLLFGPDLADLSVPPVLKLMQKHWELDQSIRVNAVIVLGELLDEEYNQDPKLLAPAVATLNQVLQIESQTVVKYRAAEALGKIGPAAKPAITNLSSALQEKGCWELRHAAAQALGKIAYDQKNGAPLPVYHKLFGSLTAPDPAYQVRLASIQALTWLGPPPKKEHQDALYNALAGVALNPKEDPTVQLWAHVALMSIKGDADSEGVKAIGKLVTHKDIVVRVQALQALNALGLEAKQEVMTLVAALDDEENIVKAWAVLCLHRMERFAEPAEMKLIKIGADEKWPPFLRDIAKETVAKIQGKVVTKTTDKDKDMK